MVTQICKLLHSYVRKLVGRWVNLYSYIDNLAINKTMNFIVHYLYIGETSFWFSEDCLSETAFNSKTYSYKFRFRVNM